MQNYPAQYLTFTRVWFFTPILTLSTLWTGTGTYTNSVDQYQITHNVLSEPTLFAILFWFLTETAIWNYGSDQIQITSEIQGWKG